MTDPAQHKTLSSLGKTLPDTAQDIELRKAHWKQTHNIFFPLELEEPTATPD
jgi:hypothetical protein